MTAPSSSSPLDDGLAERTYLAEERTFGAWIRTALTMLVTSLAVSRFIYEREPSGEAFLISLLLLWSAAVAIIYALSRFSRAHDRAVMRGLKVPPSPVLMLLFLLLLATLVLAFALVVKG